MARDPKDLAAERRARQKVGQSYREATDLLFMAVTQTDLAELLDLPRSRIAHARLEEHCRGQRPPPAGWETAVLQLARARVMQLQQLVAKLEKHLAQHTEAAA